MPMAHAFLMNRLDKAQKLLARTEQLVRPLHPDQERDADALQPAAKLERNIARVERLLFLGRSA